MTDPAGPRDFATTRWTVVVAAGGAGPDARAALESLCRAYWVPLYVFARRRGAAGPDAADLVQGFFAELLAKGWAADADPARGRFRSFLLTAFTRFTAHERDRDRAAKRGGGVTTLSLDVSEGESVLAASGSRTPEQAFERRWALTLLSRALGRVRDEFVRTGRAETFAALEPFVGGAGDALPYADICTRLGTTEGAVKLQVHRLRARYRDILREEVRDTVTADADVDAEIRDLLAAVAD